MISYWRFLLSVSYCKIVSAFSAIFWLCLVGSIVNCCIPSIRVYVINVIRFYKSVSLLLSLIYNIVLYIFWYFLVYAIANCVLSISLRLCNIKSFARFTSLTTAGNTRFTIFLYLDRRTCQRRVDRWDAIVLGNHRVL